MRKFLQFVLTGERRVGRDRTGKDRTSGDGRGNRRLQIKGFSPPYSCWREKGSPRTANWKGGARRRRLEFQGLHCSSSLLDQQFKRSYCRGLLEFEGCYCRGMLDQQFKRSYYRGLLEFEGCYCWGLPDHQGDGVVCASQKRTGGRRHNHQLLCLGQGLNALMRLGKEGQDSEEWRPARGQQAAKV